MNIRMEGGGGDFGGGGPGGGSELSEADRKSIFFALLVGLPIGCLVGLLVGGGSPEFLIFGIAGIIVVGMISKFLIASSKWTKWPL